VSGVWRRFEVLVARVYVRVWSDGDITGDISGRFNAFLLSLQIIKWTCLYKWASLGLVRCLGHTLQSPLTTGNYRGGFGLLRDSQSPPPPAHKHTQRFLATVPMSSFISHQELKLNFSRRSQLKVCIRMSPATSKRYCTWCLLLQHSRSAQISAFEPLLTSQGVSSVRKAGLCLCHSADQISNIQQTILSGFPTLIITKLGKFLCELLQEGSNLSTNSHNCTFS
jgi:hypothetical protein